LKAANDTFVKTNEEQTKTFEFVEKEHVELLTKTNRLAVKGSDPALTEHQKWFREQVKSGNATPEIQKILSVSDYCKGCYTVPTEFNAWVIERLCLVVKVDS
jgi:hypothetical protein